MNNKPLDSSIKVRKETKQILSNLDFVKKGHSYHDIVLELLKYYKKNNGMKRWN